MSVHNYPNTRGINQNVIFVNHNSNENNYDCIEEKSKLNSFSAKFTMKIAQHFI